MDIANTISVEFNGKPMEVIHALIEKRKEAFKEASNDAVVATAITIIDSLKPLTKKVKKPNKKMYWLTRLDMFEAGWWQRGKNYYRKVVRNSNGHINWVLTRMCRDLTGRQYIKGAKVHVWKIQLLNENLNRTLYYAYAQNEKDVRNYAENVILARLLNKERGMAEYALGMAQAKLSTKSQADLSARSGSKQFKLAAAAALIDISEGEEFSLNFTDALRYSMSALKNGEASFDFAMKKAANKIAGRLHVAFANKKLDEDVETPFPEVAYKRRVK